MLRPVVTSSPARPRPIAFAHRGASAYAPENTIAAFRLALDLGATGLESDVWLSADGLPVLAHDLTIRPPGRRIRVTTRSAAGLASFNVPTLAGLYDACGTGFELSLDVEHPDAAVPALRVAEATAAAGRLWLCHYDLELLTALRRRSTDVRLVDSTRPRRIPEGIPALVSALAERGIDCLNMHWRDWTADRVALVHDAGLVAFGWDAQDETAMDRLLDLDIDGIYSDYPDRLGSAIARRA